MNLLFSIYFIIYLTFYHEYQFLKKQKVFVHELCMMWMCVCVCIHIHPIQYTTYVQQLGGGMKKK